VADGGAALSVVSAIDFSKVLEKAKPVYFPEIGTDLEQVAMQFHSVRNHDSYTPEGAPAKFVTTARPGDRRRGMPILA